MSIHILNYVKATQKLPEIFAITQQNITPNENSMYHLNSIMQPATATQAPVVGIAITSEVGTSWLCNGSESMPGYSSWLCALWSK